MLSDGIWRKVSMCVKCEHKVTFYQKMHSGGCCPYCGHLVVGTVLAVEEKAEQLPPPFSLSAWVRRVFGYG